VTPEQYAVYEILWVPLGLAALALGGAVLLVWLSWVRVASRALLKCDRWLEDHERRLEALERR
jgi:hypothetical protein